MNTIKTLYVQWQEASEAGYTSATFEEWVIASMADPDRYKDRAERSWEPSDDN